jgi:hypothetical protein
MDSNEFGVNLGGKDSLVALDIVRTRGAKPHLLYVADGLMEYENSPRLQAIVRMNSDIPIHVGACFLCFVLMFMGL